MTKMGVTWCKSNRDLLKLQQHWLTAEGAESSYLEVRTWEGKPLEVLASDLEDSAAQESRDEAEMMLVQIVLGRATAKTTMAESLNCRRQGLPCLSRLLGEVQKPATLGSKGREKDILRWWLTSRVAAT